MIIDVWRQKKHKGVFIYYYKVDKNMSQEDYSKSYIIRYICDGENCKNHKKVQYMYVSGIIKSKHSSYNKQLCKSCIGIITNNKKNPININVVRKSFEDKGYILLSDEYVNAKTKLEFLCPNMHHSSMHWNNWNTGKRCGKCAGRYGIVDGKKRCNNCGMWKEINEYHNSNRTKDGRRAICKSCRLIYQRSDKGKKEQAKRNRKWERSDKGKIFNKKYKIHRILSNSIRRSLKGNKNGEHWENIVGWTLEEFKKHISPQFEPGMSWDNHGEWHIDHIRPIASFNITDYICDDFIKCWSLSNLQPLWAEENMKKGDKWDGYN